MTQKKFDSIQTAIDNVTRTGRMCNVHQSKMNDSKSTTLLLHLSSSPEIVAQIRDDDAAKAIA